MFSTILSIFLSALSSNPDITGPNITEPTSAAAAEFCRYDGCKKYCYDLTTLTSITQCTDNGNGTWGCVHCDYTSNPSGNCSNTTVTHDECPL